MKRVAAESLRIWNDYLNGLDDDERMKSAAALEAVYKGGVVKHFGDAVEYVVFVESRGRNVAPMPDVLAWTL